MGPTLTQPSAQCDLVRLRGYLHEDQACLAWGWLHSYRQSPWARLMHPTTYAKTHRVIIETLLAHARDEKAPTQLLVACDPQDEHTIYGFACGQKQLSRALLHYVWVKPPFRRQGIASLLVGEVLGNSPAETAPLVVSHASDQALRIVRENAELRDAIGGSSPTYPLRFNPMLAVNPDFEVAT
jgi:ribosomal protein S18 acetylase RimI-like enzyme